MNGNTRSNPVVLSAPAMGRIGASGLTTPVTLVRDSGVGESAEGVGESAEGVGESAEGVGESASGVGESADERGRLT